MKTVFSFGDYKKYLKSRLGPGQKILFASHIGCQPSFISQVLSGKPNLSLEQGVLANDFFHHSDSEGKHFMLLLQLGRAGSERLMKYFAAQVRKSLDDHNKVASRISPASELSDKFKFRYYSSWVFSAIHMLASLPLGDQEDLFARKTNLSRDQVDEVVGFLIGQKLLLRNGKRIVPTKTRLHLAEDSPHILNYHKNFRLRTIEELRGIKKDNLHYSILMAVSKSDALKIRDVLLKAISDVDQIITPSAEETACQMTLDLFEI